MLNIRTCPLLTRHTAHGVHSTRILHIYAALFQTHMSPPHTLHGLSTECAHVYTHPNTCHTTHTRVRFAQTLVDTVAPTQLYIHSPSGLLRGRPAWLRCPAKNLLLVIHCHHGLQKERDRLREKPTHAELWGPSKKLDHLTEISSPPLFGSQVRKEEKGSPDYMILCPHRSGWP